MIEMGFISVLFFGVEVSALGAHRGQSSAAAFLALMRAVTFAFVVPRDRDMSFGPQAK